MLAPSRVHLLPYFCLLLICRDCPGHGTAHTHLVPLPGDLLTCLIQRHQSPWLLQVNPKPTSPMPMSSHFGCLGASLGRQASKSPLLRAAWTEQKRGYLSVTSPHFENPPGNAQAPRLAAAPRKQQTPSDASNPARFCPIEMLIDQALVTGCWVCSASPFTHSQLC